MKKKFLVFSVFLFILSNCNYQPIYSTKNMLVGINNIEAENTNLNNKIVRALKQITSNQKTDEKINIKIETFKDVVVKSKDEKGNPKIFELILNLELEILNKTNSTSKKRFEKRISFNNDDDKFKLSEYQKELENSFVKELVTELINYLSSYK